MEKIIPQDQLRQAVAAHCRTQKELADEIGIDPVYFNLWLNGKTLVGKNKIKLINAWLEKQSTPTS